MLCPMGALISQDEARHLTDLLRADGTLDEAEASGALSGFWSSAQVCGYVV